MTLTVTGPADIRDQAWLDGRIVDARNGIEAVVDIARNWHDGRGVGRLHPGVAPADYIKEHVGIVGREAIVPLLTESNWSNRQIAAVAGVSPQTVTNVVAELSTNGQLPDRPTETLGADGKVRNYPRLDPEPYSYGLTSGPTVTQEDPPIDDALWDSLMAVIDAIEGLAGRDAASIAATVPERRRAATAKRLRKLGTYLGRIAWTLEGSEAPE